MILNSAQHIAAHAVAGGIIADVQGGNFGHGFFSAGITKGFQASGKMSDDFTLGLIQSAVVGGTASKISGGKFANGASTAAFQYLFNAALSGRTANARRIQAKRIQQLLIGSQDGHITLDEAKAWYKYGNGVALTADLSKIDFGTISASDFPNGVGSSEYINTQFEFTRDGLVYGTIKLTLLSPNTVTATFGYDDYDFNINWSDGRHARNVATYGARVGFHRTGTPFRINLQGVGTLNP